MTAFNVLDRHTPIGGASLLEASAGTGKTFTLQHLYIRHLLKGVPVQEIVVITFTRAATRELKNRLRKGLKEALEALETGEAVDYLASYPLIEAKSLLKKALSDIDLSPIRTIHGFLGELLNRFAFEGQRPLSPITIQGLPLLEEKVQLVRDYLRSSHSRVNHLPYQEEILLSFPHFELEVAKVMDSPDQSRRSLFESLKLSLEKLSSLPWTRELLLDLPKWFKKGRNGDGTEWITALIDHLETDSDESLNTFLAQGSPLRGVLEENNRRERPPKEALYHQEILDILRRNIIPLTTTLTDKKQIIKTYGEAIYPLYRERMKELGPDELLTEVGELVDLEPFSKAIREAYRVVLVDEFQDTDPIQWKILSNLFLHPSWKGTLTLVGDPKQAIYRFRKADLYTYFKAKKAIGPDHTYQLTHNFRSHPTLIRALNHLFSSAPLLYLPALNEEHPYEPVMAGISPYELKGAPLVLVEAENEMLLFDYISQEINTYSEESIALLVKDRFQAERLKTSLEGRGISSSLYRTPSWEADSLLPALQTVFKAIENPESRDRVTHLFATPFFRSALFQRGEKEVAMAMRELFTLQDLYSRFGAPAVFEALLPLGFGGKSFGEWILGQEEGKILFERLEKLFLQIEEAVPSHRFQDIYEWIEKLYLGLERQEAEERPTLTEGNIPLIMTIHMSKGLEFDVVFALGVIAPIGKSDDEEEAETLRQLYVALTRAKKRLYLPLGGKKGTGRSSFEYFIEKSGGKEPLLKRMRGCDGVHYQEATPSSSGIEKIEKIQKRPLPPPPLELPSSAPSFLSFTSIREKRKATPRDVSYVGGSGTDFGTRLHELLATLPLSTIRQAAFPEDLLPFIDEGPFALEMARLVFVSYKTPLITKFGSFCLEDVEEVKMIREGEFLFLEESKGIFTGFIDVAFEHLGKLFIIDWKSHLLTQYDQKALEEEMRVGDYLTQEKLYRKALKYHIGSRFEERFGGSFFLFVRGLNKNQKGVGQDGVWYVS